MVKKIFVTGASGFTGNKLCRRLVEKFPQAKIYALVRDPSTLQSLPVIPIEGTLEEVESHSALLKECHWVFHLGANASFGAKSDLTPTNITPVKKLVKILSKSRRLKRIIFTSSIGAVDRFPGDYCEEPLDSLSAENPTSNYGRSKLEAEKILTASSLNWTIIRPSWIYGPGMRLNSHLAVFCQQVLKDRFFTKIYFPGKFSVIYIDDMVDLLILSASSESCEKKIIYGEDGLPVSAGEIFLKIREIARKPKILFKIPSIFTFFSKFFWRVLPFSLKCMLRPMLICTNHDSLRSFSPKVSFQEGIKKTYFDVLKRMKGVHIITGAASGIGFELAKQLSKQKKKLLLIDKSDLLPKIALSLQQDFIVCDLAGNNTLEEIDAYLFRESTYVEGLINCAGIGFKGRLEEHSKKRIEDITKVNFITPAVLCSHYLPGMKKRGFGYILNIASSIAENPLPGMSIYAATKSSILSLGKSLYGETIGTGVRVSTILPSGTKTGFQKKSGVKVLNSGRGLMKPNKVAEIALKSIEGSKKVLILIGWKSKVLNFVSKILPGQVEVRLWNAMMKTLR